MDPLSALSIAATCVAFVQFSLETLSVCRELRDSTDGALSQNADLEARSKSLNRLTKSLQSTATVGKGSKQNVVDPELLDVLSRAHVNEKRVRDLARKCSDVAVDILDVLNKLKVKDRSISEVLKKTLRAMREKKTIEKLEVRLREQQAALETALMVNAHDKLDLAALREHRMFDSLDGNVQQLLNSMSFLALDTKAEHAETRSHIISHTALHSSHITGKIAHAHSQTRSEIKKTLDTMQITEGIKARRRNLLDSLYFPEYQTRREEVESAHMKTLKWIFEEEVHEKAPTNMHGVRQTWDSFVKFLQGGEGLYWVNGKAGSGKSTLMSFILDAQETIDHLKTWTTGRSVNCISYFFWRAGTPLQKSHMGMLRSLLYQLISADETLCEVLYSDPHGSERLPAWTEKALQSTLTKAFQSTKNKVFVLVDGLDELVGDPTKLIELCGLIQDIDKVKLCVSSRPEIEFEIAFEKCLKLRLQDLNSEDIRNYVKDRLHPYQELGTFSDQVADRSDGIFIWTVLVTKSLIQGYMRKDSVDLLRQRLNRYPRELDELYGHMLENIDPLYKAAVAQYFRIVQCFQDKAFVPGDEGGLMIYPMALLVGECHDQYDWSDWGRFDQMSEDLLRRCNALKTHIENRSAGLLSCNAGCGSRFAVEWGIARHLDRTTAEAITDMDRERRELSRLEMTPVLKELASVGSSSVVFMHRSAYDFVFDTRGGREFLRSSPETEKDMKFMILQVYIEIIGKFPHWVASETFFRKIGFERSILLETTLDMAQYLSPDDAVDDELWVLAQYMDLTHREVLWDLFYDHHTLQFDNMTSFTALCGVFGLKRHVISYIRELESEEDVAGFAFVLQSMFDFRHSFFLRQSSRSAISLYFDILSSCLESTLASWNPSATYDPSQTQLKLYPRLSRTPFTFSRYEPTDSDVGISEDVGTWDEDFGILALSFLACADAYLQSPGGGTDVAHMTKIVHRLVSWLAQYRTYVELCAFNCFFAESPEVNFRYSLQISAPHLFDGLLHQLGAQRGLALATSSGSGLLDEWQRGPPPGFLCVKISKSPDEIIEVREIVGELAGSALEQLEALDRYDNRACQDLAERLLVEGDDGQGPRKVVSKYSHNKFNSWSDDFLRLLK